MKTRWTRWLLVAVLLLALPPGAAIAACMAAGPGECCCSDACPKPGTPRVDAPSCCDISDATPVAPTVPAVPSPAPHVQVVDVHAGSELATTVASLSISFEASSEPPAPPPVPLFTLHAAFLI